MILSVRIWLIVLPYWLYVWANTQMSIVWDAKNYAILGDVLYRQGLHGYFSSGVHSEILYPLLVAAAMSVGHMCGMAYDKVLGLFQLGLLSVAFFLVDFLLRKIHVRPWLRGVCLVYFCLSPAILNMALCMFSEILALPLCLTVIILLVRAWENMPNRGLVLRAVSVGVAVAALIFVKGIFEFIFPFLLLPFFVRGFTKDRRALVFGLMAALCIVGAVHVYKSANQRGNGQYVLTDRGGWALYGNTIKRTKPSLMTSKTVMSALLSVPGEGVCLSKFSKEECGYWNFMQADKIGIPRYRAMLASGMTETTINAQLMKESAGALLHNIPQYIFFWGLEAGKIFFWESTAVGFVTYPPWLSDIYANTLFKNGIRFVLSLLTIIAFMMACRRVFEWKDAVLAWMVLFICLYASFYALFTIVNRYVLPIAPLFLIMIAWGLHSTLPLERRKRKRT